MRCDGGPCGKLAGLRCDGVRAEGTERGRQRNRKRTAKKQETKAQRNKRRKRRECAWLLVDFGSSEDRASLPAYRKYRRVGTTACTASVGALSYWGGKPPRPPSALRARTFLDLHFLTFSRGLPGVLVTPAPWRNIAVSQTSPISRHLKGGGMLPFFDKMIWTMAIFFPFEIRCPRQCSFSSAYWSTSALILNYNLSEHVDIQYVQFEDPLSSAERVALFGTLNSKIHYIIVVNL